MQNKKVNLPVLVITLTATALACMSGITNAGVYEPGENYTVTPSGPYYHQIYSATSTDGINWSVDDTLLFDHASVPGAVYFGNKVYLYYVNAEDLEHEKLSVGISEDKGMTFTVHDVHISGSNSPYPVDPNPIIDGGQIRLTYLGNFNQGETNKIVTATSSDGINFTEEAVIFTGDVYDPDLFYDAVGGEWVLFLNSGSLVKTTASSPTTPFIEDTDFSWSAGSISSTHKIGDKYYTYYAGMSGICVAEYLNGSLSNIADGIVDFPRLTADPTVAVFGPNDYKMFFKTVVEGGGGEEGDWTKEEGVRIPDAVSSCTILVPNGTYRMYYTGMDGILSAVSSDGLNWTVEYGVRISPGDAGSNQERVCNCAVIETLGGYRMIYEGVQGKAPDDVHKFFSATSTDGVNWTKEDGIRLESQGTSDYGQVSVPDITGLPDGSYRMYYVGDFYHAGAEGNSVRSAISHDDGLTWTREGSRLLGEDTMDPDIIMLEEGEYRMFYTASPPGEGPGNLNVYSALSSDGLNWTKEEGSRLTPGGAYDMENCMDPDVVELSDGSYRMYYSGMNPSEEINILSAISPETEEGSEGDWIKESGIRIEDGDVPYVLRLDDGMYRVYYSNPDGIFSAISEDGINFTKENGVRLSGTSIPGDPECQVHGATVVRLDDGSCRMYYVADNGGGGPGYGIHRIYSAISSDGLDFTREGVRIESAGTIDNAWASVPEIVRTFDGRYRLYYCTGAEGILIASAISDDGLNFTREYGPGIGDGTGVYGADPAVCKLPDGTYWMFFTSPGGPMPPWYLEKGIYSARSTDGVNFTKDPGVRVSPGGVYDSLNTYDPTVIALPDGGFRMYYGGESELGVVMLSAISPEENNPPNTPSDPSPTDQATGISINADLSWTGGDPDVGDTVTYDVYFGTSSPPPLKETIGPYPATQSSITYDPGTLSYNTKYYWKIVATDNHAASTTGPLWDFTTVSPPSDEDNPDVATGLASLGDKLVVAYGYKASEGGWTWYNPDWPPGANTLTTLYAGRGYWIKVSEACNLVYGTNTCALDAGWNLIAWLGW